MDSVRWGTYAPSIFAYRRNRPIAPVEEASTDTPDPDCNGRSPSYESRSVRRRIEVICRHFPSEESRNRFYSNLGNNLDISA